MKNLSTLINIKRVFSTHPNRIVIAAAARTPWLTVPLNKDTSHLVSFEDYISSYIVDNVIKRSRIDLEYIQTIYVLSNNNIVNQQYKEHRKGFLSPLTKNVEYIEIRKNGSYGEADLKLFTKVLHDVKLNVDKAFIIGNVHTINSNFHDMEHYKENIQEKLRKLNVPQACYDIFVNQCRERFLKAQQNNLFDDELASLTIKEKSNKRIIQKCIQYDEYEKLANTIPPKIGACAVMMSTESLVSKLNLQPLAYITLHSHLDNDIGKDMAHNLSFIIKELHQNNVQVSNISHWETDDPYNILPLYLSRNFCANIKEINRHGDFKILFNDRQINLFFKLTHLVNMLRGNEFGAFISYTLSQSNIVLVQNILPKTSVVFFTLYTTKSCPLCDEMVAELERNFAGLYKLEKVFIDCKENVKFLRLYHNDIPVLFLNGRFFCMHHLNVPLLKRRLQLLKNQENFKKDFSI